MMGALVARGSTGASEGAACGKTPKDGAPDGWSCEIGGAVQRQKQTTQKESARYVIADERAATKPLIQDGRTAGLALASLTIGTNVFVSRSICPMRVPLSS
jgi:hypothetical protein